MRSPSRSMQEDHTVQSMRVCDIEVEVRPPDGSPSSPRIGRLVGNTGGRESHWRHGRSRTFRIASGENRLRSYSRLRSHQNRRTDADGGTLGSAYARHFARSSPPPCGSFPGFRNWLIRWNAARQPAFRFFLYRAAAFDGLSSRPADSLGRWGTGYEPSPTDADARDRDRQSARRGENADPPDSRSIQLRHPGPPSFPRGSSHGSRLPDRGVFQTVRQSRWLRCMWSNPDRESRSFLVPRGWGEHAAEFGFACMRRLAV